MKPDLKEEHFTFEMDQPNAFVDLGHIILPIILLSWYLHSGDLVNLCSSEQARELKIWLSDMESSKN